jgi:hypothetical protein
MLTIEISNLRRPGQKEAAHLPNVLRRESRYSRETLLNVRGQPIDHRPAPPSSSLPLDDEVPDMPAKLDQLSVDR